MRALTILTVAMGVLILLGTAGLVAVIIHRSTTPTAPAAPAPVALDLNQPAGTRIAGIAATQDRLAIELQGGGPDRVVLVDPHQGTIVGRIAVGK